jgi:acyl-CoA thioesterase
MNTMLLVGAEEVSRAASRMQDAAEKMTQAAASLDHSLEMQRRFMDDWLNRLADALKGGEK